MKDDIEIVARVDFSLDGESSPEVGSSRRCDLASLDLSVYLLERSSAMGGEGKSSPLQFERPLQIGKGPKRDARLNFIDRAYRIIVREGDLFEFLRPEPREAHRLDRHCPLEAAFKSADQERLAQRGRGERGKKEDDEEEESEEGNQPIKSPPHSTVTDFARLRG